MIQQFLNIVCNNWFLSIRSFEISLSGLLHLSEFSVSSLICTPPKMLRFQLVWVFLISWRWRFLILLITSKICQHLSVSLFFAAVQSILFLLVTHVLFLLCVPFLPITKSYIILLVPVLLNSTFLALKFPIWNLYWLFLFV